MHAEPKIGSVLAFWECGHEHAVLRLVHAALAALALRLFCSSLDVLILSGDEIGLKSSEEFGHVFRAEAQVRPGGRDAVYPSGVKVLGRAAVTYAAVTARKESHEASS